MNNSFSFQRLSLLIRKQWAENNRFYGLATLALFGLMAIVFIIFWILMDRPQYYEAQTFIIYFIGLFLLGCIFASTAFQPLGEKEKGQYWLSIPATHAEKLVTVILFSTVLFFLVYTACFLLVKFLAIQYVEMSMASNPAIKLVRFNFNDNRMAPGNAYQVLSYFILGFIALQSLFLLGSIYFKKFSFVKTVIIAIAFFGIYIFLMAKMFKGSLPDGYSWEGYKVVYKYLPGDNSSYHLYSFGETFNQALLEIVKWIWAPVFWVIAWFRLQEKEI